MSEATRPGTVEFLAGLPLFEGLDAVALERVAGQFVERRYRRDDLVWRDGDPADEFIVVRSGELEVMDDGGDGVIARLGPGECAGEVALFLDAPRTATVRCRRPARVLALAAAEFQQVVDQNATALAHLTQLLSRRLADRTRPPAGIRVIGVIAQPSVRGASLVARSLSELLPCANGTRPLLVRLGDRGPSLTAVAASDGAELPDSVRSGRGRVLDLDVVDADAEALERAVSALVHVSNPRHAAAIIDVPGGAPFDPDVLRRCCDVVIEVRDDVSVAAAPSPSDGTSRSIVVVNRLGARGPSTLPVSHVEPFILPDDPHLLGAGPSEQVEYLRSAPDSPAARVLGRLARSVTGTTIGLALGGGAAFGIAHVGVMQALELAGIPVDVVAGTSMGSIVAIGYASGLTASDMVEVAGRIGNVPTTLSVLDPSLSGAGILSGRRLVSIFEPFLAVQTFAELEVPCRVVATDIETGHRVELASGDLIDAFRASCSIPMVFVPAQVDGRTLVDGAMVDPVPAEVARHMGADIVIAINVVPRPRPGVSTSLTRAYRRLSGLVPFGRGRRGGTDFLDVLMNSLQVVQHELGVYTGLSADVRIDVDLADFTWIEFYRALEIIERGRSAGEAALPDVRAAVENRLTGG